MSSSKFKPGPPSEEAQVLSERLNEILTTYDVPSSSFPCKYSYALYRYRSNIIPLSSLCIHPGKSAWVLYVDATCINYDGNALDATLIAMVAALQNSTYRTTLSKLHVRLLLQLGSDCTILSAATLPKATYNEDTGRTTCTRSPRSPLEITRLPLSMSFGVFDT